jgi:hypothetical protein
MLKRSSLEECAYTKVVIDSFALFSMLCILLFICCCISIGIYVPYLSLMMYVVSGTFVLVASVPTKICLYLSICSKCILVQNVYLRKYVKFAKSASRVSKR